MSSGLFRKSVPKTEMYLRLKYLQLSCLIRLSFNGAKLEALLGIMFLLDVFILHLCVPAFVIELLESCISLLYFSFFAHNFYCE